MKIAVIGAAGWLGGAVAREAMARGHEVTGLGRDVAKLDAVDGLTRAAEVDVRDPASIGDALVDQDAVVVSVTDRSGEDRDTIVEAAHALIAGLPRAGVTRLVFVGGGGSLEPVPGQRYVDSPDFPPEYKAEALAQSDALALLRAEGQQLRWSYISPPPVHLEDGPKQGGYELAAGDAPINGADGRLTSGDLAAAVMDEIEEPRYLGERFTAAY